MEIVDLERYELTRLLGSGADYEVRAAVEVDTGRQVILKRPTPQMIVRNMHQRTEARTEATLGVYQDLGSQLPQVVPILGYTERLNHDAFFKESLGQEYRIMVEERAAGIPLVADMMARITGVPIGLGQNLFALHPLRTPPDLEPFGIQRQLMDTEEVFYRAGYLLLDLRPQNVFYQPGTGRITIIDYGDLVVPGEETGSRSRQPRDIHNFFLELLKFYITPEPPPADARGYRDPYGMLPVVNFEQELDQMAARYSKAIDPVYQQTPDIIRKVRVRGYNGIDDFRHDLMEYLAAVNRRNETLTEPATARQAWHEALDWLKGEYWRRYLFDPEQELAGFQAND